MLNSKPRGKSQVDEAHICVHEGDLGSIMAKQENFERWQLTQNGTLGRIEGKLDSSLGVLDGKLEESLDKIHFWMYGLMGSLSLALILMVINLVIKKG
jgi:hypothetical protein